MDPVTADLNTLQSYVLLTTEQIQKISQLFNVYDRDSISQAVQTIINEYIKEHTREDVKRIIAENTWEDFTNKFNEGMFNKA